MADRRHNDNCEHKFLAAYPRPAGDRFQQQVRQRLAHRAHGGGCDMARRGAPRVPEEPAMRLRLKGKARPTINAGGIA